jgi:hypothetical protein
MPDPIASQQAAIEASIGSAQRIAMRIVDLPKDKREAGIEFVRREYEDALEKFDIDGEQARAWLELQIKGIRSLISEIEASSTALADKLGASSPRGKQYCLSDADRHPGRDVVACGGPKLLKRAFCSSVNEE